MKHGVRMSKEERANKIKRAAELHKVGYSRLDIAESLDISEPTVRNLLGMARFYGWLEA